MSSRSSSRSSSRPSTLRPSTQSSRPTRPSRRVEVSRSSVRPQSRETVNRIIPIASAKERADPRLQLLPDSELRKILESYSIDTSQMQRRDQLLTSIYSLSEIPTPFRKSYTLEDIVDLIFEEDINGDPVLETLNNTKDMSIFEVLQREKVISPQLRVLLDQPIVFDLIENVNLTPEDILEELKSIAEEEKEMEPQYQKMTHAQLEKYFEVEAPSRWELSQMNVPMVQVSKSKKLPKTSPILEMAFSGIPVSFFPAYISGASRMVYDMIFKEISPFLGTREIQESRKKIATPARGFRIRNPTGSTPRKPKITDFLEIPVWESEDPVQLQIDLGLEALENAKEDIRNFLIRGNSFPIRLLPSLELATQIEYRDLEEFPPMKKPPQKRPVEWDIEEYMLLNNIKEDVLLGMMNLKGFRLSEIQKLAPVTWIFVLSRGQLPPTLQISDVADAEVFIRKIIQSYPDPELAEESLLEFFRANDLKEISNLRFQENGLKLFRKGAQEPEKVLDEIHAVPFPTETDPHRALLLHLMSLRSWLEYPAKNIPFGEDTPPTSGLEAYNWLLRSSDEKILDHFGVQPQYSDRSELILNMLSLLNEPGAVLVLEPEICSSPLAFGTIGDWECREKENPEMRSLAEFVE